VSIHQLAQLVRGVFAAKATVARDWRGPGAEGMYELGFLDAPRGRFDRLYCPQADVCGPHPKKNLN
jgi:hypothetical protein